MQPALHHIVVNAQKYTASDGKSAGFIAVVTPGGSSLVESAAKVGAESAAKGYALSLQTMKREMYHDLYQTLTQSISFSSNL